MHRSPIRAGAHFTAFRQARERFENDDQRLRRLQAARVQGLRCFIRFHGGIIYFAARITALTRLKPGTYSLGLSQAYRQVLKPAGWQRELTPVNGGGGEKLRLPHDAA